MSDIPNFETLEEAKEFLRENWENGVPCPCCKQFVKLYKRKLNSSMARTLINLYRASDGLQSWHHHTDFRTESNDYPYLKIWELIEEKEHDPEDTTKKNSGYWRLTSKGIDFVQDEGTVKSHIRTYNSKFYGFAGKQVNIRECLGKKFNYEELMNS